MKIKNEDLDDILKAHLQKDEKVAIYKPRVEANTLNGFVNFKATWSWWAFFGSWAFFLYRKMYLQAGVIFVLTILLSYTRMPSWLVPIASGVSAFYFYTKKLHQDLKISGYGQKELPEVLTSLKQLGGFHQWAIWLAIALNVLFLIIIAVVISNT